MNINVRKKIAPVITAAAIEFSATPLGPFIYLAEEYEEPDHEYKTEIIEPEEDDDIYFTEIDDDNDIIVNDDDDIYEKTKPETQNKNKNEDDKRLISRTRSIPEAAGGLTFITEVYGCSDNDTDDGYIRVIIDDTSDSRFFCSIDGGRSFRKMAKKNIQISNLAEGCYSLCVMKDNDRSTMSCIHTVSLYSVRKKYGVTAAADGISESIYKDGKIRIQLGDTDPEKKYQVTIDGGKSWQNVKDDTAYFYYLESGNYTVSVREGDSEYRCAAKLEITVPKYPFKDKCFIPAEYISQLPELPTGCEITALTMLLRHIGYNVDKLTMADNYLPKGEYRNSDFNEVFVGNPRNHSAYGCFANPIVKAAEDYIKDQGDSDKWKIRNITGCTLESLFAAADQGHPAVVWSSMNLRKIGRGKSWVISKTGKKVTWTANEHCMLFLGYNIEKNLVYVNDPLRGTVAYNIAAFDEVFKSMGSQAIVIVEK